MKNYLTLKAKVDTYPSLTDAQIKTNINAKDIPAKKIILSHDIKAYLIVSHLWLPIKDSTSTAARRAIDSLNMFPDFDITNAVYLAELTTVLDNLLTATLISSTDKTNILGLGDTLESWADQNWEGDVTLGDIQAARMQ